MTIHFEQQRDGLSKVCIVVDDEDRPLAMIDRLGRLLRGTRSRGRRGMRREKEASTNAYATAYARGSAPSVLRSESQM